VLRRRALGLGRWAGALREQRTTECLPERGIAMRVFAAVFLVIMMLLGSLGARERDELVLAWDDGGYVNCGMCPAPMELREMAVMFEAPEGFTWLREIQCYVCNDQVADPYDPWAPTTGPCTLAVWGPYEEAKEQTPGPVPLYEFESAGGYPEDAWITFILPEAVDLSPGSVFPDGVFFVGMKWVDLLNPWLAVDWDPVVMGNTWRRCPSEWERCSEYSVLIRAVVSDSSGTPVQMESWGRVKSGHGAP
jgi:hypothetical protein